jgi:hypothetical protein
MIEAEKSLHWMTLVFTIGIAACGNSADDDDWSGTIETLPSGMVRVVNPVQGIWETGEPWRLLPDLQLGKLEGADHEIFASIADIEVDRSGRVYVLDRTANELRIFTADGTHIRTVGRSGGGPGEYNRANGLQWIGPDSLLVIDQEGNRYNVLSSEGEYVRSVQRTLGFYGWVYSGGYHEQRIYEQSFVSKGEEIHPVLFGTAIHRNEASTTDGQEAGGPLLAGAVDTVELPRPNAPQMETFSVRNERGGMVMDVPFAAQAVYHLDASGTIWHGHGDTPSIFRSTFAGDTVLEVVIDWARTPVLPAELEEWQAGPHVARFRERGGVLDMNRIPKTKPLFDGIFVDPDGYVWLTVPAGPAETVFAVLDQDGRYLGRLQVAGVERDAFLTPVVRNGRLYFVGEDELDVQRVYGFRIEGRADANAAREVSM